MAKRLVDPEVYAAVREALDYTRKLYAGAEDIEERVRRLGDAFQAASLIIEREPERGKVVRDAPSSYRYLRLKKPMPGYVLFYHWDKTKDTVLIYLMRHEVQRPYSASTHRKKAAEAQQRVERMREDNLS